MRAGCAVMALCAVALSAGGSLAAAADAPTGSFTIDNGAANDEDGFVSIQYQASGPNPIAVVYTSVWAQTDTDGVLICPTQWPYGQAITTFALSKPGCEDNNNDGGPKTVYVQFVDTAGLHSPVYTQTIYWGSASPPPVWTLNPQFQFLVPQTVTATSVAMRAAWATSPSAGVSYDPKLSINSGAFQTPSGVGQTATAFTVKGAWGRFLQAQITPVDSLGQPASPPTKYAGATAHWFDQSDARYVTYTGTWKDATSTGFLGGTDRYATAKGATVTFSCGCGTISWVTSIGPKRGVVNLAVDGTPAGSVDLYSATAGKRRVMWSYHFPTNGPHTLRLTVAGTTGRARIDADAFLVG